MTNEILSSLVMATNLSSSQVGAVPDYNNYIDLTKGTTYTVEAGKVYVLYFGAVGNVETNNATLTICGQILVQNSSGQPDWQFQGRNNCLFITVSEGDTYLATGNENLIWRRYEVK